MKVIAIANNKGGCAKTTTAYYLSYLLAASGLRTLLVDLDSQANLSERFLLEFRYSIADVLGGAAAKTVGLLEAVYPVAKTLHICPSEAQLANVALGLLNDPIRGRSALRRALQQLPGEAFDVVLVDCPPEAGILLVNALLAADGVLCPAEPEPDALAGVRRVAEMVEFIRSDDSRTTPVVLGTIATRVDNRTTRHADGIGIMQRSKLAPLLAAIPERNGEQRDRDLQKAYRKVAEEIERWLDA